MILYLSTILLGAWMLLTGQPIGAQELKSRPTENPIYIADSPTAWASLLRLPELLAQDNLDEASRLVDQVITDLGDRLIESHSPDIYITVRSKAHRFVLEHPELLDAYRIRVTPWAQAQLDADQWQRVARDAWLTEPGLIASLHLAQTLIEGAHFHSGLRIITELKAHPDAGARAHQILPHALLAARYINTDQAWQQAAYWSQRAGQGQIEPVLDPGLNTKKPNPRPIGSLIWNTDQPEGPITLDGIVPGNLGIAPLTPHNELEHVQTSTRPSFSGANWDPTPWTAPVVWGNLLYTNDGITVSCFDRFTLRPIWRLQTTQESTEMPITVDARARLGRIIEDATTLTLDGDDLYIPAGIPRNNSRAGDARLLKLDAKSGQVQWAINIQELDESLVEASIRGQVLVDEGIVVVGARTNNRRQRLINLAVIGLDAQTGNLRWIRQIASAGSLPFQQMGQLAHSPMLHNGVAYWTDRIGLGFAIESATGQVLWARSLPPPDIYARASQPSFSSNTPIINAHGFFTLSPDGSKILQLDLDTGEIIATRPAQPKESLYLLGIGDLIACVSKFQVTYYPAAQFAAAPITRSALLGGTVGIRGRVIKAGDRLIVPVDTGVEILDPHNPQTKEHLTLDTTGNIIALDGQILVVDEMNISSFLAWDIASGLLSDRIETDPASAITLAELAYRAGRTDEIVLAVVRAMRVLFELPIAERKKLNTQLFDAVLEMVEMVEPTRSSGSSKPLLTSQDQSILLDHLGTLAQTHQQVVAHRMALGAWHHLRGNAVESIGAYQDILDQPALSASMWEGAGIAVRGGLEASRRVGAILTAQGYSPYRSFDQLAKAEQRFVEESADPDDYEQLAKRYPWSTIAPKLWLGAATRSAKDRKLPAAINAASKGLEAAQSLNRLGIEIDQLTIDQLAEQALTGMIATNRARDAQSLASTLIEKFPKLTIRIAGEVITKDQIALKAQASSQLPLLGDAFIRDQRPLLITGSPIKPTTRIDQGGIVLYAPQLGRAEYVRAGRGAFETVWSLKAKSNQTPIIPWQDQTRTLILWPEGTDNDDTGTLEAIETTTGRLIWSITNIRSDLAQRSTRTPDDLARVDAEFATPTQEQAPINQLMVVTDGHTIIISDRIGRAVGVDVFSGNELWRSDLPANRVYDIDLKSSVLGVCGIMYIDQPAGQREGSITSIAASIDPRTGQSIQVIDRFGIAPRWIRVGNNGNLYVATDKAIVAINTKEGLIDWVLNDDPIAETIAGWISGDQLVVLNSNMEMWPVGLAQGTRTPHWLDLRQRIRRRGWIQAQTRINTFTIAGSRGFAAFDQNFQLIALDPIETPIDMVDVAWATDRTVFLQSPMRLDDHSVAELFLLDSNDARLLDTVRVTVPMTLDRQPKSITAITGGVLVGYNEVSIFVRTIPATQ